MPARKPQPCRKCEGVVYREDKDPLGIIMICTTCGECTYLDHQGRPATPQEREKQSPRGHQPRDAARAARTPEEAGNETTAAAQPEVQEEVQEVQTEVQAEVPEDTPEKAGSETMTAVQPEDQEEAIAEDQLEAQEETAAEVQPEAQAEVQPEPSVCGGCGAQLPGPYSRRGEHETCTSCGALQMPPPEDPSPEWTIGAAMEMHHQGILPTQIAKALQRTGQPQQPAWRINHWAQGCIRTAANTILNARIKGGTEWTVLTTPVQNSHQDYHLWNIMDNTTGYILETRVASAEESESPLLQHIMQQAIARTNTVPSRIITNAIPTNLDQALRTAVPDGPRAEITKIKSMKRELLTGNRLGELTSIILRRSNEPKGKRTKESLQIYAEGITLDLNLFRTQGGPMDPTPAEAAGLQPTLRTWEDAAIALNHHNSARPNRKTGTGEKHPQPTRERKPAPEMPEPALPEPETVSAAAAIRELRELVREMERERLEFINSYSQLGQDITTTRQMIRVLERREIASA